MNTRKSTAAVSPHSSRRRRHSSAKPPHFMLSVLLHLDPAVRLSLHGAVNASFDLSRDAVFAPHANILDASLATKAPPESLNLFRGNDPTTGDWVRVTLRHCSLESGSHCQLDASLFHDDELHSLTSSVTIGGPHSLVEMSTDTSQAGEKLAVAHTLALVRAGRRRRRARRSLQFLDSPAPPYERLDGCPVSGVFEASIGLVLDYGFTSVHGGREGALLAAAEAVSRANAVYEPQLGLRLAVSTVVINEQAGLADYAVTGPNAAPADGSGSRSCPEYGTRHVQGHGVDVYVSGIDVALGMLAQWSQAHRAAGGEDLWHLMTDCFPAPGTVGLASRGALCRTSGYTTIFSDSDHDPDPTGQMTLTEKLTACDNLGYEGVVTSTSQCAAVHTWSNRPCDASDDFLCSANGAVSSNSDTLWHTFAHEVGHNLGGAHTFSDGGLMGYTDERAFYDAGDICPKIATLSTATPPCLAPASPTCGDGLTDAGEQCDDGNVLGGDGCGATCEVECGYTCVEELNESGSAPSICTLACGNGVVDVEMGEECDIDAACCVGCRLTSDAECCGGECCDSAGRLQPAQTLCGTEQEGQCVNGQCEVGHCSAFEGFVPSVSGACRSECSVVCFNAASSQCITCALLHSAT